MSTNVVLASGIDLLAQTGPISDCLLPNPTHPDQTCRNCPETVLVLLGMKYSPLTAKLRSSSSCYSFLCLAAKCAPFFLFFYIFWIFFFHSASLRNSIEDLDQENKLRTVIQEDIPVQILRKPIEVDSVLLPNHITSADSEPIAVNGVPLNLFQTPQNTHNILNKQDSTLKSNRKSIISPTSTPSSSSSKNGGPTFGSRAGPVTIQFPSTSPRAVMPKTSIPEQFRIPVIAPGDRSTKYYDAEMRRKLLFFDPPTGLIGFLQLPHRAALRVDVLSAFAFQDEFFVIYTTQNLLGARLFCRYFDVQGNELGDAFPSFAFPEFAVHCPIRNSTHRISISVASSGPAPAPVPLIRRQNPVPDHFLAVCLAPLFGDEPKWLMLLELIEHYRIQGVTHFYVYVLRIDEFSQRVLSSYAQTGEVEVIYLVDNNEFETPKWQFPVIRDCTFRSRTHSKWSVFADLDERLLMTSPGQTLASHLRTIVDDSIAAVQLRQRWVLKTRPMPDVYKGREQVHEWMPSIRWHNTSGVGPVNHTTKCIVDTTKVYGMGIHYPEHLYPTFRMVQLDPTLGYVRHYRDTKLGMWGQLFIKEVAKFGSFGLTDYPSHLLGELESRVQQRAQTVYSPLHLG